MDSNGLLKKNSELKNKNLPKNAPFKGVGEIIPEQQNSEDQQTKPNMLNPNSPYLKGLPLEAKVSPQHRRELKIKHLDLDLNIFSFDSNTYDIEDVDVYFENSQQPLDSSSKKEALNSMSKIDLFNIKGKNLKMDNEEADLQADLSSDAMIGKDQEGNLVGKRDDKGFRQEANTLKDPRFVKYSPMKALAKQSPVFAYICEDEDYQEELSRIRQFQNGNKRIPFANPTNSEENGVKEGKIFLHQNKTDSNGKFNREIGQVEKEDKTIDIFRQMEIQELEQVQASRNLVLGIEDTGKLLGQREVQPNGTQAELKTTKTEIKKQLKQFQVGSNTNIGGTGGPKKIRKQAGALLDSIRSKGLA